MITAFVLLLGPWMYRAQAQLQAPNLNFGIKGTINYTTLGASIGQYNGTASPQLYGFVSKKMSPGTLLMFESGYASNEFRHQQNETRYTADYLDFSLSGMWYPNQGNSDIGFLFGVRPSFLFNHSTLGFKDGSSITITDPTNKNKNGMLDLGLTAGISINLSSVVNLEIQYNYSLEEDINSTSIYGRPSTFELGIRVNAFGVQANEISRQEQLKNRIEKYKKGVLLVMLTTPFPSGYTQEKFDSDSSSAVIRSVYQKNNQIVMNSFASEWSFCPVYYFHDVDAHKLSSGQHKGIFLNHSETIDTALSIDTATFFIASICMDVSAYTQRNQLGLFIYDDQFQQLGKPFNPNLMNFTSDGNPVNYINTKKTPIFNSTLIRKRIRKLNSRLLLELQ